MQIKITNNSKKTLIEEYNVALEFMASAKSAREKLYYFSAILGAIRNSFNAEFDSWLVLIHVILQNFYDNVSTVEARITSGQETVITLPNDYFPKLEVKLKELKHSIDTDQDCLEALRDIALITYSITGNGYYLTKKGKLKI